MIGEIILLENTTTLWWVDTSPSPDSRSRTTQPSTNPQETSSCPTLISLPEVGYQCADAECQCWPPFLQFYTEYDGILDSVPIAFSASSNEVLTFRITVTTEPYFTTMACVDTAAARKKRRIIPALFTKDYVNVAFNLDAAIYLVEFSPSVFVTEHSDLYVNVLTLNNKAHEDFTGETSVSLTLLLCSQKEHFDRMLNASCFETLDEWATLEDEHVSLGCAEEPSVAYQNYAACLGVADTGKLLIT